MSWRPLKHFCMGPPQYGLNIPASEYVKGGLRFIRTTDIHANGGLKPADSGVYLAPLSVEKKHVLVDGDILLSRSGTLGRCLLYRDSMGPATFAGYLVRFRSSSACEPRYLAYCAGARFFNDALEMDSVSSTIANFNAERYANTRLPWWAPRRQRAIVDFLDIETARIDGLIAKKRRTIELLRLHVVAARRAQFDRAAGRRGSVPLRRLVSCLDGRRVPLNQQERWQRQGPYPYWGAGGVVDHLDEYLFDDELVLLGEDGAPFFDNRRDVAFHVSGKLWVNNHVHVLKPNWQVSARWLRQMLNAVDYATCISGSTRDKLTQEQMMDIRLPNLPSQRQESAALELDALETHCTSTAVLIARQVELLAEHRQALITAAVTGELEVPGAA